MTWPIWVFEGCDGAGKSTLRRLTACALGRRNVPVFEVGQHAWLDPMTTRLLVQVREQRCRHNPRDIAAAYVRDKQLHLRENLEPARRSAVVFCDRSVISDAVYLEALYGIPAKDIFAEFCAAGLALPRNVVFVDVEVEVAVARIANRGRATRHYERAADLLRIRAIYQRVLADPAFSVVIAQNEGADAEAVMQRDVLPSIEATLPS